ncbi:hypothetical protein JCM3766R1_000906 [Sporobolomyces carnicolor]
MTCLPDIKCFELFAPTSTLNAVRTRYAGPEPPWKLLETSSSHRASSSAHVEHRNVATVSRRDDSIDDAAVREFESYSIRIGDGIER